MSIWKDGRGRTHVGVQYRGRRVHRTLPQGTTQEDARKLETKLRLEAFRVIDLGEAPSVTCLQAVQRYLDEEVLHFKAASEQRLKAYRLEPWLSGVPLSQIHMVGSQIAKEYPGSAATKNRMVSIVRRTATLAYRKWGWLKEPLGDKIQHLPGGKKFRHVYLDASQVGAIVAAIPQQVGKDAVLLAAFTGLRRSELWSLTEDMVRDNVIYLQSSKTGAPRAVPVIPKIRPALRRWLKTEKPPHRTFYNWYQRAVKELGWKEVVYHTLRHSCASMLIQAGVPLYVVGQILGHQDLSTTQRYAHLSLDTKRKALRRIG